MKHYTLCFSTKTVLVLLVNLAICRSTETNTKLRVNFLSAKKMEGMIVGGDPIDIELCPSAVLVYNTGSMCAGSILNSYTILTAAHCFDHNIDIDDITVHTGSQYRFDENASIYDVKRVVRHKDYNKKAVFAADIAIVFLDYPIELGKRAQKAILVRSRAWRKKSHKNDFIVTGWGMIRYNGPLSEVGLMKTKLKYIPLDECSKLHGLSFTPDMFCLYGDAKRDSCKGDSGGGVLWNGYLVGIVSHGDGCAGKNKPSVYISVFYYREWIRKVVLDHIEKYCKDNINLIL